LPASAKTCQNSLTLLLPHGQDAQSPDAAASKERLMASVFVVSREPRTCNKICDYLRDRGHRATLATDYDTAMEALRTEAFDLLIIDVQGLRRGEQGATFIQFNQWLGSEFKSRHVECIYLLHKGARRPVFRIEGQVIKKPFPIEALGEALRSHLDPARKSEARPQLSLDSGTNVLHSIVGQEHLTNIEATLLAYLMEHEGEVLHPKELLVDVWQYHDSAGASTLVRAHISNLRRKLRSVAGTDRLIQTIRGKGYRYVA